MSAASAAERGRRLIESQMTSTCTISERPTGGPVTDPETGEVTAPEGEIVYSGPCRLKPADTQGSVTEAGGAEVFSFDYWVSVPVAALGIRAGQRVVIDTCPDPDAVGMDLEVQPSRFVGEHITARRLACKEVS